MGQKYGEFINFEDQNFVPNIPALGLLFTLLVISCRVVLMYDSSDQYKGLRPLHLCEIISTNQCQQEKFFK
jgi:hypothetical protein